jgi:hypothetical protein
MYQILTILSSNNFRNLSSMEDRKLFLIFVIIEESVFRPSRLVINVVTTGNTIEIVGLESLANFLVADSNGSSIS